MRGRLAYSRDPCFCGHMALAHDPDEPSVCLRCPCDEYRKDDTPPPPRLGRRPRDPRTDWDTRDEETWLDKM